MEAKYKHLRFLGKIEAFLKAFGEKEIWSVAGGTGLEVGCRQVDRTESIIMRVLWTHNFNPAALSSGCFMYTTAAGLRDLGVSVSLEYLGNLRSPLNIVRARKRIAERAKEYDIVHAQYGSACALVTAAVSDRPTVLTVRGSDWNTHDSTIGFAYFHTRFARTMTRLALPHFTAITPVSRRLQRSLAPFAPQARFLVLPSSIDLSKWHPRDIKHGKKDRGGRQGNGKKVLFVSLRRSNAIKRYDLCQKVMALVNQSLDGVVLRAASGVSHAEMPEFVAACDVILCTSGSEGWPNCIKEALACNLPFVSTDVSDLAEIAAQEPSCRVCASDADELARNLCEVLSMPPPANLRRFVEPMGVKVSSEKLVSLYESLLQL